jgi:hypothetical protein
MTLTVLEFLVALGLAASVGGIAARWLWPVRVPPELITVRTPSELLGGNVGKRDGTTFWLFVCNAWHRFAGPLGFPVRPKRSTQKQADGARNGL